MFYYKIGHYSLNSEISIPFLSSTTSEYTTDLSIFYSDFNIPEPLKIRDTLFLNNDIYYLSKNNIYFKITKNNTILINKQENSKIPTLSLVNDLFGVPFGYLLYKKGYSVLHGSAIELNNNIYLFMGISGTGKSSTVSALINNGLNFICDDLIILNENTIYSFLPKIDLCPISQKYSNPKGENYIDPCDSRSRRTYLLDNCFSNEGKEIKGCFFLNWGKKSSIKKLKKEKVLYNLLVNKFMPINTINSGFEYHRNAKEFNQILNINCYEYIRPKDVNEFKNNIDLLLKFITKRT